MRLERPQVYSSALDGTLGEGGPVARAMTLVLLFLATVSTGAAAQRGTVVGKWVDGPRDHPLSIWEFHGDGVVTTTLLFLPGAGGTYRFDGRDLTYVFGDGSRGTAEISLVGDTMVQQNSVGAMRLIRAGSMLDKAHPLHGAWDVDSPDLLANRYMYRPDGTFIMQSVRAGTYTLSADTVTVSMPDYPMSALRFRIRVGFEDTALVGLDASADFHPPILRRAR